MSQMHSCFHTRHWSIYPLCRNGQMHRFKFEVFPISYNICMSFLGIYLQKCLQLKLCDQAAKCICAQHCFETFLPMHLPYWRQKGQGRFKYCLDTAIIWIQQSSRSFSQTDQVSLSSDEGASRIRNVTVETKN